MSHPYVTRTPPLLIKPVPFYDGDRAHAQRLVLRTPVAQWAAAALSEVLPDGYWAPACLRDDDGASWRIEGATWRYLDRLAFQVVAGDEVIDLTPLEVEATPERVVYHYAAGSGGSIAVVYTLLQTPEAGHTALSIMLIPSGGTAEWTLRLKANLDIRPVEAMPDPSRHRVNPVDERLFTVVNKNRWLGLTFDRDVRFTPGREQRDTVFSLGRGDRVLHEGKVQFIPSQTRVFIPGVWQTSFTSALRMQIQAGTSEKELLDALDGSESKQDAWFEKQDHRLETFGSNLELSDHQVRNRIYVMAEKLWVRVGNSLVPDTHPRGTRTPEMRATLEGLLHNAQTLLRLDVRERFESLLRACISYQDPRTGRFPNRWPEDPLTLQRFEKGGKLPADYYDSGDLGLLLFTLLDEVIWPFEEPDTQARLWTAFKLMFAGFRAARTTRRLSGPVLLENGLLLSVPHQSWMDGKRVIFTEKLTATDLPTRCPVTWHTQDLAQYKDSHYAWEQYQYPSFYLPEINALWLRSLRAGLSLARQADETEWVDELSQVEQAARNAYKPVFWNEHAQFLYNIVSLDRRVDGTPSSAVVEAAALLGETVFTRVELEKIWQLTRNRLLLSRDGIALGLLAKDSAERVYQDRAQLHEAVMHPRETPYLARLLRMLGQEATRLEVLNSVLAHQDTEGAVFYTHEAFALPDAGNPNPNPSLEGLPVPVRATGAWCSQFCDVFIAAAEC